MLEIEKILKDKYWFGNINVESDGSLWASDGVLVAQIGPPNDNNNDWIVRFSTIAIFDHYSHSWPIEEKFKTKDESIEQLDNNQLIVYKQLMAQLSIAYLDVTEAD